MNLTPLLPIAHEAVDLAVQLFTTSTAGRLTAKGDRDYATEVDYAIEDRVRSFLASKTPHIGFIGEEHGTSGPSDELYWVLDPIDGTVNFAHTLPLCGVSLGLIAGDQPVLGVIDLPFLSARYSAVKENGAHCNSKPIHVSNTEHLAEALVSLGDYAVGEGADEKNIDRLQVTAALAPNVLRVRMFGASVVDLAWLAEGRTDASIALSNQTWDVAAGVIIATEAGALVSDIDGTPHSTTSTATVATTPALQAPLLKLLDTVSAG